MAAVSLSVGPITVQIDDEDETAKALTKLARKELVFIAMHMQVTSDDDEEGEDG